MLLQISTFDEEIVLSAGEIMNRDYESNGLTKKDRPSDEAIIYPEFMFGELNLAKRSGRFHAKI